MLSKDIRNIETSRTSESSTQKVMGLVFCSRLWVLLVFVRSPRFSSLALLIFLLFLHMHL